MPPRLNAPALAVLRQLVIEDNDALLRERLAERTGVRVCLAVICEALKRLKLRRVKPDAILVMDNLRPHRATQGRDLLDQAGIGLMYLPRYSPEFNPIEQAWAKVKERLKAKAARSLEALEAELRPALDTPSPQRLVQARRLCSTPTPKSL